MRAGSSIRESRPFMASRPMSGADADTALVEEVSVTSANINDGRAGPEALPDNPGEVFADSAYRGNHFRDAVRAKGGIPRIVATGMWGRDEQRHFASSKNGTNRSIGCGAGSRRSSGHGSAATAYAECDGEVSPKPPSKSTSLPSPTTSNEHAISSNRQDKRGVARHSGEITPSPFGNVLS